MCKNPTSKQGHIHRYQGLRYRHIWRFTVIQNKTLCWQISEVTGLFLVLVVPLIITLNNIVKHLFLVSLMFVRVLTIHFVRSGIRPLLFPPIFFPWHLYFLHYMAKWDQTPLLFPCGYTTTLHFPASLQFAEAKWLSLTNGLRMPLLSLTSENSCVALHTFSFLVCRIMWTIWWRTWRP